MELPSSSRHRPPSPVSGGLSFQRHMKSLNDDQVSPAVARSSFTVAWICAIGVEKRASVAMLDEIYPSSPQDPGDSNNYTLGRVGNHNVVVACLPMGGPGTGPAATVATNLTRSFPNIRFGLMVGVGGGAPGKPNKDPTKDIRLGDVVVSCPTGDQNGVIQYDFGKMMKHGKFHQTGSLNQPPEILLTAASSLHPTNTTTDSQIAERVREMLKSNPTMQEFCYQGSEQDQLFREDYEHGKAGETCESCNREKLLKRIPRTTRDPVVHYGLIGSANLVMRHAITRERLRRERNIICFEMEAAGLMNRFPCLVIRGICDYADTHKNKSWQPYAAAVAAGYAKELLGVVPKLELDRVPVAADTMSGVIRGVDKIGREVSQISRAIETLESIHQDQMTGTIFGWLSPINQRSTLDVMLCTRESGTGQWFLEDRAFLKWRGGGYDQLYCHGMPGAGKTIIASIAIEYLEKLRAQDSSLGVAFYYCNHKRQDSERVEDILACLLAQLLEARPDRLESIRDLYKSHCRGQKLRLKDIQRELRDVAKRYDQTFIVIDALDEFGPDPPNRGDLLREISYLQEAGNIKLLVTFRTNTRIRPEPHGPKLVISANEADILEYLDKNMAKKLSDVVQHNTDLQAKIKRRISAQVKGMFLLAYLYIEALVDKHTPNDVDDALESMGGELSNAYDAVVERIMGQRSGRALLARKVLFWIVHAKRPLTTLELQHALAIKLSSRNLDPGDLCQLDDLVAWCAGLVSVDNESKAIHLVHNTTQEYFLSSGPKNFLDLPIDIASFCLTYLSFDTFGQGYCPTDETLRSRLQSYPFLSYAARNWGKHMPRSDQDQAIPSSHPVSDIAVQFLRDDSKTESSGQVLFLPGYSGGERSQFSPRMFCGMHLIAHFNLPEFMHRLAKKMDPDAKDSCGRTPLSYAAENGNNEILQLLLTHGVDRDSRSDSGLTALAYAIEEKKPEIVGTLLTHGAKVNYKYTLDHHDQKFKRTPLSRAAEKGDGESVGRLLANQAEPDLQDEDEQTPLARAVEGGYDQVVKMLLAAQAKTDYVYVYRRRVRTRDRDNKKYGFSWKSSQGIDLSNFTEAMQTFSLLFEGAFSGGDDDGDDDDGKSVTGVRAAEGEGNHVTEGEFPVSFQAPTDNSDDDLDMGEEPIQEVDELKRSPLFRAAEKGYIHIMKLFIDHGANVNFKDETGKTPLFRAAKNGYEEAVNLLLENGADPNTKEGRVAVLEAAITGLTLEAILPRDSDKNIELMAKEARPPGSQKALDAHEGVVSLLLDRGFELSPPNARKLLFLAASHNFESLLKNLLQVGVEVNCKDEHGRTPVFLAALKCHEAVMRLLLGSCADPNIGVVEGHTPLSVAAANNHEGMTKLLLMSGADPNIMNNTGSAPLHFTAGRGHETVSKCLLEGGADPNIQDSDGHTPLLAAAGTCQYANVKLLLEQGADPNILDNNGLTALLVAAGMGHEKVAQLLLESGAEPDIGDNEGRTPLFTAIGSGHLKVTKVLLESNRVDPNTKHIKGFTPLSLTAQAGDGMVAKLLLEHGADPGIEDGDGHTPLLIAIARGREKVTRVLLENGAEIEGHSMLCAAAHNGNEVIVKHLLDNGVNLELGKPGELTPLARAVLKGNEGVIKLLLEKGADPNCRENGSEYTPLVVATTNGDYDMVKLLLENGGDATFSHPTSPFSPLAVAAAGGHTRVAELLMEHGADPNHPSAGHTPLIVAARTGCEAGVKFLLASGADPNSRGSDGRNASSWAAEEGHAEIVALLLESRTSDARSVRSGRTGFLQVATRGDDDDGGDTDASAISGTTALSGDITPSPDSRTKRKTRRRRCWKVTFDRFRRFFHELAWLRKRGPRGEDSGEKGF
ncbi:hypothetical protein FQN55_007886 [Onygenales sp. PD_40]|nr:hypothetical protein FQN55_007886 [Onygenales sp. PD_40]